MTSLPSAAHSHSLDGEMSRLRFENQTLAEELAQCQADKEFVWSLWKRLQVASPDITQAVGMVIQREKDKAEKKDRKVLDILTAKDDKIDELQKVIASQSQEVSLLLSKKIEISENVSHLVAENEELKALQAKLQQQLVEFEARSKELKEKEEMARTLSRKEEEISMLKKDKDDLSAIRDTQKQRMQVMEEDIQAERQANAKLNMELSEVKRSARKAADMVKEVEHKSQELEVVRKEFAELWDNHTQLTDHTSQQAHLIQQLRSLQGDTQKMLKNQEDAFTMESSSIKALYEDLKTQYSLKLSSDKTMRAELLCYKQQLLEQDTLIADLQRQLQEGHNRSVSTQATLEDNKEVQTLDPETQIEYRLHSMQSEIDTLKDKLKQKDKFIHTVEEPPSPRRSPLPQPMDTSTPGRERRRRAHSSSPERTGDKQALRKRLKYTEQKLEDTETLLKHKNVELEEVKAAHNRRLERLKALQGNYRLCRKQLKTLEEEVNGPAKKKKKLKRSHPKSLQKEDSDAVWNELTYFKTEHKKLLVENMNLQEEVDTLKVQAAQDAATVHELRTCLEQEKEELAFLLEQQRCASPEPDSQQELEAAVAEADVARTEADNARHESASDRRLLDEVKARLQQVEKDKNIALRERDALVDDKRTLKNDVNGLKQEVADRRIEIADLKRDLLRLQREMKKQKRKEKARPTLAKQYQRVLNRSIQTMSHVFDDFDRDGWEEVTETSGTQDTSNLTVTTTTTTDSLGEAIAQTARVNSPQRRTHGESEDRYDSPRRDRQNESPGRGRDHVSPSRDRQNESPGHGRDHVSPSRDRPLRRDVALSPITVQHSNTNSPHQQVASSRHVVSKKAAPSPAGRQLITLRQRITSLQKEVAILKEAKQFAVKRETDQRESLQQAQADLQLANQRLATNRASVQRLTGELERLRVAKDDLETRVDAATIDGSTAPVCTDQEWVSLQARLKVSTTELSKQLTQIKDLKAENSSQAEKIETLQTKLNHVERDLSQKRLLVDDLRIKVKVAQESAQTDTEVMVEAEDKLKQLAETNSRFKTQMESTRQRIAAVSREKLENEDKVIRLSQELEKKSKQLSNALRKNRELEAALTQFERTAQQQLSRLASQSETAMLNAHTQLQTSTNKLEEFNKFVKILGHALINSIHQAQALFRQQTSHRKQQAADSPRSKPDPALAKAQKLAAGILNLSQSDLEDLMSVTGSPEVTKDEESPRLDSDKKNKKWIKKLEKILSTKKEFGMALVELFMDKVEERSQLAVTLSAI